MNTGDEKRKLHIVPFSELPPDEQELLTAYRTMDDRARFLQLRVAISAATRHPRHSGSPIPGAREPLRLITGGRA
jgi:hypothetical protein